MGEGGEQQWFPAPPTAPRYDERWATPDPGARRSAVRRHSPTNSGTLGAVCLFVVHLALLLATGHVLLGAVAVLPAFFAVRAFGRNESLRYLALVCAAASLTLSLLVLFV